MRFDQNFRRLRSEECVGLRQPSGNAAWLPRPHSPLHAVEPHPGRCRKRVATRKSPRPPPPSFATSAMPCRCMRPMRTNRSSLAFMLPCPTAAWCGKPLKPWSSSTRRSTNWWRNCCPCALPSAANPPSALRLAPRLEHVTSALDQIFAAHLHLEETVVFPAIAEWLSPAQIEEMSREMHATPPPPDAVPSTWSSKTKRSLTLFVAQRFHRVQLCRLCRRIDSEE